MTKLRSGKTYYGRPLTRKERKLRVDREVKFIEYSLRRSRPPRIVREHFRSFNVPHRINLLNVLKAVNLGGRPYRTLNWNERRVKLELIDFVAFPPPGMKLDEKEAVQKIMEWNIQMEGPPNSLFAGETFDLSIKFPENYPLYYPDVRFKRPNIPVHPRVYRDGSIHISLFREDWNAGLTVEYICLYLSKMLRMCEQKRRPPDYFCD